LSRRLPAPARRRWCGCCWRTIRNLRVHFSQHAQHRDWVSAMVSSTISLVCRIFSKGRRMNFLEWAQVHGNYYGTSRSGIEAALQAGQDVLLEIDWQGAQQVRRLFPAAIGVFILPPSLDELERRLCERATDSAETIARRVAAARRDAACGRIRLCYYQRRLQRALHDLLAVVRADAAPLRCAAPAPFHPVRNNALILLGDLHGKSDRRRLSAPYSEPFSDDPGGHLPRPSDHRRRITAGRPGRDKPTVIALREIAVGRVGLEVLNRGQA
jgi:ribose 1,5-bisphosphokinase PhnN